MKKGGDAPCNFRPDPNEYCRQQASTGIIENNENTVCNITTGVCKKPTIQRVLASRTTRLGTTGLAARALPSRFRRSRRRRQEEEEGPVENN